MDERTSIDVRVEHMLTEARVLLPGAQALFGFQMAVLLTEAFADLPASSKLLHAVALCCIALAVILLMAPASFHRIAFRGENTEFFHRIGSRFVIASAFPLAAGITSDLYVAVTKALDSAAAGAVLATATAALLVMLWFIRPLMHRNSINENAMPKQTSSQQGFQVLWPKVSVVIFDVEGTLVDACAADIALLARDVNAVRLRSSPVGVAVPLRDGRPRYVGSAHAGAFNKSA